MFPSSGKKFLAIGGAFIVLAVLFFIFCYFVSDNEDVWICKENKWVTTGIPSYPKPQDPCGKKDQMPNEEKECIKWGGVWKRQGPEPFESCNMQTKDRGVVCTDNNDCEGMCLVDMSQIEIEKEKRELSRTKIKGRCSDWRVVLGCFGMLENGNVSFICVD